jgi:hypothetical protein
LTKEGIFAHLKSMNALRLPLVLLASWLAIRSAVAAGNPTPQVDVILWFDTEDYLLPADDDACKRLADMLT